MCDNYSDSDSDSNGSGIEDYVCPLRANSQGLLSNILPFDPKLIENVILTLSDKFDFRVIMNNSKVRGALILTGGLTLAGALVGRHYGGNTGAALGGVVGGACGLGIVAVSMRDVWEEVKPKLSELYDIVYDYLAGMGLEDYKKVAVFLAQQSGGSAQLAMIIMDTASQILGKQITSRLTAA